MDADTIISQLESQNSALKARLDEAEVTARKLAFERDRAVVGLEAAMLAVPLGVRLDALKGIADHVVMDATWKPDDGGAYVKLGADGAPATDGNGNAFTIKTAVNRLPEFFYPGGVRPAPTAPASSSASATSSGPASSSKTADADNPWIAFNLTKQGDIWRQDRAKALKLATEANKPVFEGGRVGVMPDVK